MSQPTTTTPAPGSAPDLATLRQQLQAAAQAYPELRRGLRAALADIDRSLGVPAEAPRRDRRAVGGLR